MPIEFRCTSCFKLLRTPDESAGKKAKCPQCGTIVDVPIQSAAEPQDHEVPSDEVLRDPFAKTPVPDVAQPESTFNPYTAPETIAQPFKTEQSTAGLQHTKISFDDVVRKSWELTLSQLSPVALCGLVLVGAYIPVTIVSGLITTGADAAGEAMAAPVLPIIGQIVQQVFGFLVGTFFELAVLNVGLRLGRTGTVEVSDLFKVSRLYGRGLIVGFVRTLITFAVVFVFIGPAALTVLTGEPEIFVPVLVIAAVPALILATYVIFRLYLVMCFLVDRDLSVTECFRASSQFMSGNKLTTFLSIFVIQILAGLAVIFTCCVGIVVVWPYTVGIVAATIYLLVTGQPMHNPRRAPA